MFVEAYTRLRRQVNQLTNLCLEEIFAEFFVAGVAGSNASIISSLEKHGVSINECPGHSRSWLNFVTDKAFRRKQ